MTNTNDPYTRYTLTGIDDYIQQHVELHIEYLIDDEDIKATPEQMDDTEFRETHLESLQDTIVQVLFDIANDLTYRATKEILQYLRNETGHTDYDCFLSAYAYQKSKELFIDRQ